VLLVSSCHDRDEDRGRVSNGLATAGLSESVVACPDGTVDVGTAFMASASSLVVCLREGLSGRFSVRCRDRSRGGLGDVSVAG
jgi:hypothetical protein